MKNQLSAGYITTLSCNNSYFNVYFIPRAVSESFSLSHLEPGLVRNSHKTNECAGMDQRTLLVPTNSVSVTLFFTNVYVTVYFHFRIQEVVRMQREVLTFHRSILTL